MEMPRRAISRPGSVADGQTLGARIDGRTPPPIVYVAATLRRDDGRRGPAQASSKRPHPVRNVISRQPSWRIAASVP